MKVIICGSRAINDLKEVEAAIEASGYEITEVVSGQAGGVDTLGELWAIENGIPYRQFPIMDYEWERYGKGAGHQRNIRMAEYGEASIAIWNGVSGGTRDMIAVSRAYLLLCYIHRVP